MFGFGWVRTHLGDVFLKSIRVFFWFLVGFLEKGTKSVSLEFSGSYAAMRLRGRLRQASGTPRQSKATP